MNKQDVLSIQESLESKSAQEIVKWALDNFAEVALASSLSIEDQCVTRMMAEIQSGTQVFTLDTGRLFPETYDTMDLTTKKYDIHFEVLFPEESQVRDMVESKRLNLFYDSIENRKQCCNVRKVQPLEKKLSKLDAWITGLRREQAVTRGKIHKVQWDENHHMVKINPIADWTYKQVWEYINKYHIPYNILQDDHFPSIGCAPCTRPIKTNEDLRAGRWWWENPESKECGLHLNSGDSLDLKIGKLKL